jgi:hypothetical protein
MNFKITEPFPAISRECNKITVFVVFTITFAREFLFSFDWKGIPAAKKSD